MPPPPKIFFSQGNISQIGTQEEESLKKGLCSDRVEM